jgi:hypothetical protein
MPGEVIIYGIEVEDPGSIGDKMSEDLAARTGEIVDAIVRDLRDTEA